MALSNDYTYDDDIIGESEDDEIDNDVTVLSYPNRTFKMNLPKVAVSVHLERRFVFLP